MQVISKFNKGIRFLLCAIDFFSKCAWVIPLKDKKVYTVTNAFEKFLKQSNRKPSKIWVDNGSEFYNGSIKLWLEKNAIEMYLTHNEGKSVIAERFIRTLKSRVNKYMTSISKSVYIDKVDDIVNGYSNTYHSTNKMKPIDVKSIISIDYSKKINDKDPIFRIGNIFRILKYQNIFAKCYVPNWSEEIFGIEKVKKKLCRGHMLLVILTPF